jgi:hypothetical protein
MTATAIRPTVLLDTRPARGKHRQRGAVRRLLGLSLLLGMLVGMFLTIPSGMPQASAADLSVTTVAAPGVPCAHLGRGLRILCHWSEFVAVQIDALTVTAPR